MQAKQMLRAAHDAVFRDHVYDARHGWHAGYRLVGRMPWFQKPLTDPDAIRELGYFAELPLEGRVAYDVGANEGSHTLVLRRRTGGNGRVYSFEPEPASFARIARLVALNRLSNVSVFAMALGDESGVARMAVPATNSDAEMAATLDPALRSMLGPSGTGAEIAVPVMRLDDWRSAMRLPPPDFMKIDVEGYEVAVLDGASETLSSSRPTLFVEIHGADPAGKTANARGVLERLAPLDYRFRHLESGEEVSVSAPERAAVGHLICEPV